MKWNPNYRSEWTLCSDVLILRRQQRPVAYWIRVNDQIKYIKRKVVINVLPKFRALSVCGAEFGKELRWEHCFKRKKNPFARVWGGCVGHKMCKYCVLKIRSVCAWDKRRENRSIWAEIKQIPRDILAMRTPNSIWWKFLSLNQNKIVLNK
jgi:hypothetical protein